MEATNERHIMYYDTEQKQFITVHIDLDELEQQDKEGSNNEERASMHNNGYHACA